MLDNVIRNLHVLWRADSIIADIHLRLLLKRSGLRAFAALIAAFGLLMLNVTGFFAFQQYWGPVWAAAAVSALDLVVALILGLIAARARPGRELELAQEVRRSALDALEAEGRVVQQELSGIRDEIGKIRSTVTQFVNHPLDAALSGLVVPLTGALVRSLRKSSKDKE
jgi:hypothetical protein